MLVSGGRSRAPPRPAAFSFSLDYPATSARLLKELSFGPDDFCCYFVIAARMLSSDPR